MRDGSHSGCLLVRATVYTAKHWAQVVKSRITFLGLSSSWSCKSSELWPSLSLRNLGTTLGGESSEKSMYSSAQICSRSFLGRDRRPFPKVSDPVASISSEGFPLYPLAQTVGCLVVMSAEVVVLNALSLPAR